MSIKYKFDLETLEVTEDINGNYYNKLHVLVVMKQQIYRDYKLLESKLEKLNNSLYEVEKRIRVEEIDFIK